MTEQPVRRDYGMPSAMFLDRDGTIIVDRHYLGDPDGVELEVGAVQGLTRLQAMGVRLIGVTNQSGVAKNLFGMMAVVRVNERVDALLAPHGVTIERWYVCPHDDRDGCRCRKPQPGMLEQAADELSIDLSRCMVVGDKLSDVATARAVGGEGILVRTGKGASLAEQARMQGYHVVPDLADVAELIAARIAPCRS